MGRTQGAIFSDTPHGGGWIWYAAPQLYGAFLGTTISANMVLTRNAQGDYSFNRTAAGAEVYIFAVNFANLKRRIESAALALDGLPFQEQFGAAAGTAGHPAGAAGMPPFTGATQLTPPTADTGKGIQVTDVAAVYLVGVVGLSAATFSLNRTAYVNNVANAITNIPVSATALPLVTQANPYVVTRAVTTPVFETADTSDLNLELSVTMANTGTLRVYGLGIHVNFNYN